MDAANPRTQGRAIPVGQLTRGFVLAFTLIMIGLFLLAAAELNRLTLELSPIVVAGAAWLLLYEEGHTLVARRARALRLDWLRQRLGLRYVAAWTGGSPC